MLNPLKFISKFIRTNNQKELDRIQKIVKKVNSLENEVKNLSDIEFPQKTENLIKKLKNGNNLNEII